MRSGKQKQLVFLPSKNKQMFHSRPLTVRRSRLEVLENSRVPALSPPPYLDPLFVVVVQTSVKVGRQLGGVDDLCEAFQRHHGGLQAQIRKKKRKEKKKSTLRI